MANISSQEDRYFGRKIQAHGLIRASLARQYLKMAKIESPLLYTLFFILVE